jgi:hypothetical protein
MLVVLIAALLDRATLTERSDSLFDLLGRQCFRVWLGSVVFIHLFQVFRDMLVDPLKLFLQNFRLIPCGVIGCCVYGTAVCGAVRRGNRGNSDDVRACGSGQLFERAEGVEP